MALDGEIIAEAEHSVSSLGDVTAVAELLLVRKMCAPAALIGGARRVSEADRSRCSFYGVCEPCALGAAALLYLGVGRVVIASKKDGLAWDPADAQPRPPPVDLFALAGAPPVELLRGVLHEEAMAVVALQRERRAPHAEPQQAEMAAPHASSRRARQAPSRPDDELVDRPTAVVELKGWTVKSYDTTRTFEIDATILLK